MFRNYSGIIRTLCNHDIFKTYHIQNPGIFSTLVYLEPWYSQNPGNEPFRNQDKTCSGVLSENSKQL